MFRSTAVVLFVLLASTSVIAHEFKAKPGQRLVTCNKIDLVGNISQSTVDGLKRCRHVQGLRIHNTNLTDLSFLDELEVIYADTATLSNQEKHVSTIEITNNDYLKFSNSTFRSLRRVAKNPYTKAAAVFIMRNRLACFPENMRNLLENHFGTSETRIQDCVCVAKPWVEGQLITLYEENRKECVTLLGDLVILGDAVPTNYTSVEILAGRLVILNTTIMVDLGLPKLSKIRPNAWNDTSADGPIVHVEGNRKLRTMFDKVTEITRNTKGPLVLIQNNPMLMLSTEQRHNIRYNEEEHEVPVTIEMQEIVCDFKDERVTKETISQLENCQRVIGNLVFDGNSGLNEYERRIDKIQHLDGCLTIRNLNFTVFRPLKYLMTVNCTKKRAAVIIKENSNMKVVLLPITDVESHGPAILLKNNDHLCEETRDHFEQQLDGRVRNRVRLIQRRCVRFVPDEDITHIYVLGSISAVAIIFTFFLMQRLEAAAAAAAI